jgi:hypothetical protein
VQSKEKGKIKGKGKEIKESYSSLQKELTANQR